MDPSLRKEREAFKRRAIAETEKSQKSREAAAKARAHVEPSKPKKAKKKVHISHTGPSTEATETLAGIKEAAKQAHRNNSSHRVLKCIMDMLKMRYINKVYERMSLDEILATIELADIRYDMRQWVRDALTGNTKVKFYANDETFLFKPALGHQVCNRKQLLARLRDYDLEGLGGITMTDIKEALHKPDKVIKRLVDDECVICITRQDKEQVVFYNNPEFSIGQKVSPELQELWHQASVDGMTDTDIDRYLDDQGLGAMQGEGRKRKAPGSAHKKMRKKTKLTKVLNKHLDNKLLKDYSADAENNAQ